MVAARTEAAEFGRQGDGPRHLMREPAAGIAGDAVELAMGGAQAEAVERDEGFLHGGQLRHRRSAMAARPSADSCGIAALVTAWTAACSSWLRACIAS